jgi:predicted nucleotidyltransferase
MQTYITTARYRQQQRQCALHQRRQRALAAAQAATQILHQEFGVERVAVFGSVLQEEMFYETSDLDLAVWGLAEAGYLRAVARLLRLSEFSIDLVRVESARPYIQEAIAQGQVL